MFCLQYDIYLLILAIYDLTSMVPKCLVRKTAIVLIMVLISDIFVTVKMIHVAAMFKPFESNSV